MDCELSRTISSATPAGRLRLTSMRRFTTASTTATVFVPDCLRMDNITARSPS